MLRIDNPVATVALISDHRILIDGLAASLGDDPGLQIVCAVGSALSEREQVVDHGPDIVVIDQTIPNGGAFDVANDLRTRLPESKVVFLAADASDIVVELALRIRCEGFLSTNECVAGFIDSLKSIAEGGQRFSPDIAERLTYDHVQGEYSLRIDTPLKSLTSRQLQVLRYLACGDSVKEVARKLHLSPKSIDNHKYRIMNKVGVRDRVQLARFAIREGLIDP